MPPIAYNHSSNQNKVLRPKIPPRNFTFLIYIYISLRIFSTNTKNVKCPYNNHPPSTALRHKSRCFLKSATCGVGRCVSEIKLDRAASASVSLGGDTKLSVVTGPQRGTHKHNLLPPSIKQHHSDAAQQSKRNLTKPPSCAK